LSAITILKENGDPVLEKKFVNKDSLLKIIDQILRTLNMFITGQMLIK
jgi:hypothetical protein